MINARYLNKIIHQLLTEIPFFPLYIHKCSTRQHHANMVAYYVVRGIFAVYWINCIVLKTLISWIRHNTSWQLSSKAQIANIWYFYTLYFYNHILVWWSSQQMNAELILTFMNHMYLFQRQLTSLLFLALDFAKTIFMASGILVNLIVSGCCRYFFSLRISEAFLFFSDSKDPKGLHPRPLSHCRSDLYRFC